MHHVERELHEGDPSFGEWIIDDVLACTPEMTWTRSADEAKRSILEENAKVHRVEIITFNDAKRPVGFCMLVAEDDPNVGPCLGVVWNFVLPEYRGYVGGHYIRRAAQIGRQSGLPILAYTHRTGDGRYTINYRRL